VAQKTGAHASTPYEEVGGTLFILPRLVVIVVFVAGIASTGYGMWSSRPPAQAAPQIVPTPLPAMAASETTVVVSPVPELTPEGESEADEEAPVAPAAPLPRVGVVAGHWGSDSGAVCPDGLREVDINLDVAQRVRDTLETLGYGVDLLEEFDERLHGYWALGLISIHADSCQDFPGSTPPATGFKVARVVDSAVPEAEDQLVACLAQCYAARTDMYYHANSVTHDMVRYHTFYEIDARTPAAIIETGFMMKDRAMLTERPDLVAQGIVDGIICFLEDEATP
jgi:N-acetylmuramoyl-L-alanine amidase